jgi:hypothetical protein
MFRPHNRMSTLARAWEEIMRVLAGALHARADVALLDEVTTDVGQQRKYGRPALH